MFTDAGSNIITSKMLPPHPAPALNIPHNKAKGSDKSYYFQPSHLEARGEANLSLDSLRGKQASSPKKSLEADPRPNTARQGCERLAFPLCPGVHDTEGEALWAAERGVDGPTHTPRLVGNV